jgi:anti-sigma regulatory factor (Ser/Thr protein kinase)
MAVSSTHTTSDLARAELRLPPDVSAPAFARRTVHDLLAALPDPLCAQLSLVASELVTNVLRHCSATDAEATLTLALAPDRVTLAVTDAGSGFDPDERRTATGAGGWGLQVLDAIADRWWVECNGRTTVTCEIDR